MQAANWPNGEARVNGPAFPFKRLDPRAVLVATDLSRSADKALEHGIAIARHFGAKLYIVHVVCSLGFTLAGPDAVELAAEASERDIESLVVGLANSGKLDGVEVHAFVLEGNMEEQMAAFARTHKIDLIVVGTHGRHGIAQVCFGSIARLISQCSNCAVLTVGPHSPGPWLDNAADAGRPLLFATAFDTSPARALPYAVYLANEFGRKLYLLHVIPPHTMHLPGTHRSADDGAEAAQIRLQSLLPPDAELKDGAEFRVESCEPALGILRAAAHIHAVTIVMGSHRNSFSALTSRLPWSVVCCVNREAKCPVLTVRG
ncbi:MAG: universal stress protein [Terracidiphilus sp.]